VGEYAIMRFKIGQGVVHYNKDLDTYAFGMIIDINKNKNSDFPYSIIFTDDEESDWYTDKQNAVADMVKMFNEINKGE
jgi:hypothetical protein